MMDDDKKNIEVEQELTANDDTPLADSESKTGIKDSAKNQDAVDIAAKVPNSDDKVAFPSFFIEESDRINVEVEILFDKSNGNLVSVSRKGLLNPEDFETLGYSAEWFEFVPVNYEEMSNYRQRCAVFRRDANRLLTDPISLRNFLVAWHLKDFSMRDRTGKKLELGFTKDGALDDASLKVVYRLNPTLLDVVLTLFEKDMMM